MATEQDLQTSIIKYITSIDGLVVNGQFSKSGIPDLICCIEGRFVAIEVKLPTGTLAPLQKHYIQLINNINGLAIAAYSVDDVKQLIRTNFPHLEAPMEI